MARIARREFLLDALAIPVVIGELGARRWPHDERVESIDGLDGAPNVRPS
jgi:hypothetical protein